MLCLATVPVAATLGAETYPTKPIRMVVPSAAGGSPDVLMRALTAEVAKTLGQSFVIDNKPGASGIIGIAEIQRAAPDGYTLGYANNVTLSINKSTFRSLPYRPDSFVPVVLLFKVPNVVAVNDLMGPAELFRFAEFADWLDALRQRPANVNVVPLLGHSTLRVGAMGELERPANAAETAVMRGEVDKAMRAGAFGVSTGTFYPPAAAATEQEIVAVCEPIRTHGGIYSTHLRDETDDIVPSMEEALRIGRELNCRVVFSHHKVAGKRNHGRSVETLGILARAAKLQPLCLDCHPYPATSTMLRLDRVRQSSRTMITWSKGYPEAGGRDFDALMDELKLDEEGLLEKLRPAAAIYFIMDEADVERIASFPLTIFGSDGLPFDPRPHPRQWGTFPRVLGRLVREQGLVTLEGAIHKMSGLAASQYGLQDRGTVAAGRFADLVLFDADQVRDRATFEDPIQPSEGIMGVWVNGRRVWHDDRVVPSFSGKVLERHAG
jgi:N-acyl-D-amino-acid deacylase